AIILPKICNDLPAFRFSLENYPYLKNLQFADPTFNIPGAIDILLGADIFPNIFQPGRILGNTNEPIALNTVFGYVLMGKMSANSLPTIQSFLCNMSTVSVETILKKFWEVETVPEVTCLSPDDKLCEQKFVSTYSRDATGRFTVSLPFRNEEPTFPESLTSSPYLAIRCLLQLAEDEKSKFPTAARILSEYTFVDDIVSGSSTLESACRLKQDLISLLSKGGFELRKWASNNPDLLTDLPISHLSNDPLSLETSVTPIDRSCTKRHMLSELARIFDPLGFLAPITFFNKYIIQLLWTLGLDWDQSPPNDVLLLWDRYKRELPFIVTCSNPSSNKNS
ncbi:hypothetical protein NQ318_005081, partial [Aromia moschata]